MPYLKKADREFWGKPIDWFLKIFRYYDKNDQYDTCNRLFNLIMDSLHFFQSFGPTKYKNFERLQGALNCCHREFLRRVYQTEVDFNFDSPGIDLSFSYPVNQMYDFVSDGGYSFDELGGIFNFMISFVINSLINEGYISSGNVSQVFRKAEEAFYAEVGKYEDLKVIENGDVYFIDGTEGVQ